MQSHKKKNHYRDGEDDGNDRWGSLVLGLHTQTALVCMTFCVPLLSRDIRSLISMFQWGVGSVLDLVVVYDIILFQEESEGYAGQGDICSLGCSTRCGIFGCARIGLDIGRER